MSEIPNGLNTVIQGLETMAESATGYRELLCTLEATIELNGWFTNYGYEIHERFESIEETIIPKITREPYDTDMPTYKLAKEIQESHQHMSIHAAESAAQYWQNR